MTYVLEMATDTDIVQTTLNAGWNPISGRYNWASVNGKTCNLPAGCTVVVIAHGNQKEIGNSNSGTIDINAASFLNLILSNCANGKTGLPARIFLSACAPNGLAQFTADVVIEAEKQGIWGKVEFFGHTASVVGPVPPYSSKSLDWTQIYVK
jgi:hypothetical protein